MKKFYESVLEIFWGKLLRVIKTVNKHAIDIISKYLKKMVRSGNAVSSHSGLIPSENLYEKRGGMLWPITTKKNLIRLRSAAFFTIFVCNLVHTYKFHGYLKPLDCVFFFFFFKNWQSLYVSSKFLGHWKQGRQLIGASNVTNFPQILCLQVSVLITPGIVFTFYIFSEKLICIQKDPRLRSGHVEECNTTLCYIDLRSILPWNFRAQLY